ncbi:MAG: hypothetical protein HYV42_05375 [Candidatus Magasanikbacteria bacterium]|nr:hypothetical protein [Candidatus Magasanikbacteria bacterium]
MRLIQYTLLTLGAFFTLAPGLASAQGVPEQPKIPEFNPLCWRQPDCEETRARILNKTVKELEDAQSFGWIREKPCLGEWGKCLPSGETVTRVKFAGRTSFRHLGDFIQLMYKYLVGIAGIVGVVVIMVAGAQYITSGGSSERITSAKKRIGGALMGVFLAYLSYLLLNVLNPSLVNLRLPQVWMVRPQALIPQFCSTASTSVFAYAAPTTDQTSPLEFSKSYNYDLTFTGEPKKDELNKAWDKNTFSCGTRFLVKDGGRNACFGDVCPDPGNLCTDINFSDPSRPRGYHCEAVSIAGDITYSKFTGDLGCLSVAVPGKAGEGWEFPEIVDENILGTSPPETELWVFCKNGKGYDIGATERGGRAPGGQVYGLAASAAKIRAAIDKCGGEDQVRGFAVKMEMNETCDPTFTDEDHWLGWNGNDRAVDLGDEGFLTGHITGKRTDVEMSLFPQSGQKIKPELLIPLAKIRQGVTINVEAEEVYDIDDTELGENFLFGGDRSVYRNIVTQ